MLLDLKNVFLEEGASQPFQYPLDLQSIDVNGVYPFVSPVEVKGTVENHAGVVQLAATAEFDFSIPCDRCITQIDKHEKYSFSHVLVLSLENEDSDEYIQVPDYRLDLDELIRSDVLLELPTKYLCREDCKGLCPQCGKNLNDGACDCQTHQIDPRLEVLKKLID